MSGQHIYALYYGVIPSAFWYSARLILNGILFSVVGGLLLTILRIRLKSVSSHGNGIQSIGICHDKGCRKPANYMVFPNRKRDFERSIPRLCIPSVRASPSSIVRHDWFQPDCTWHTGGKLRISFIVNRSLRVSSKSLKFQTGLTA